MSSETLMSDKRAKTDPIPNLLATSIEEEEDEKLRKEGELMEEIINTGSSNKCVGYDENDYVVELNEYSNCTHEYVAPKDYVRAEYKRPAKRAKEYKFKLDRF